MRFENIESGIQYKVNVSDVNVAAVDDSVLRFINGVESGDFSHCRSDFQCSRCEFRKMCKKGDV